MSSPYGKVLHDLAACCKSVSGGVERPQVTPKQSKEGLLCRREPVLSSKAESTFSPLGPDAPAAEPRLGHSWELDQPESEGRTETPAPAQTVAIVRFQPAAPLTERPL